ncbi:MAG: cyclic nucleotide-binding domain-containing protein [Spirochaetota bacterium]|nr:cyclic nucleotide-binding domain-containing protein [Spirochaetota bacterium]
MDIKEKTDLLGKCELFNSLNKAEREIIARHSNIETYNAGETILCQAETSEKLLVIAEGSIFLERSFDTGTRKGRAKINILTKGRALGCWSNLLDSPHKLMSSVVCQHPTKVIVINGFELRKMMVENYEFGFKVLEGLCLLLRDRIECAYGAMENL